MRARSWRRVLGWTAVAAIASGVGSGCGGRESGSPGATVCEPGATQSCTGPGGCLGGQTCRDDGTGWLACDCGDGSGGSAAAVCTPGQLRACVGADTCPGAQLCGSDGQWNECECATGMGGSGGAAAGGSAGTMVCTPGSSRSCVGPGACTGTCTCLDDGSGYGPCECGSGGSGGGSTGGSAGVLIGGTAGSSTGGAAGSPSGGSAGVLTGGAAGSPSGGSAGAQTGGTGGTLTGMDGLIPSDGGNFVKDWYASGVIGPWYTYQDPGGSTITAQHMDPTGFGPFGSEDGQFCFSGTLIGHHDSALSTNWGAGLGMNVCAYPEDLSWLPEDITSGVTAGQVFQAASCPTVLSAVNSVTFTITGSWPELWLRFKESDAQNVAPSYSLAGPGTYTVVPSQAQVPPDWEEPNAGEYGSSNIQSLQWSVVSQTEDASYYFCVSNVTIN